MADQEANLVPNFLSFLVFKHYNMAVPYLIFVHILETSSRLIQDEDIRRAVLELSKLKKKSNVLIKRMSWSKYIN